MKAEDVWQDIERVRNDAPLVHNITNYVVMNNTANALLAVGASPVMAHALDEVEEMVNIASALVVNIGTLSVPWIEAMFRAADAARERGIRIVFDPVGAGATKFRTETSREFLESFRPTVIRGNPSEIMALVKEGVLTKGVDSRHDSEAAVDAAVYLNREYGSVVSISGEVDRIVTDGRIIMIENGDPMMPRVTGLGCTASALTGAFVAVDGSPFEGAAAAMAVMGIAGEMAAGKSGGPGSFQVEFLDALYRIGEDDVRRRLKLAEA
ncbi:MAG: hydroxyethylthiazole kinase [Candidatus Aminicenantes bacterium]|nr:hydroxyethylthiazole kinase [Candidatus Aminicenantes bacterium]